MALARHGKRCDFLFVYFAPLNHLAESIAHIIKLKMGTSLRASVFVVWIVVKVDAFVVHQVLLMINIVSHCVFV